MSSERGKLIVFEGVGGCGKGTQVEMLRQALTERGKKVLVTCEHTRDTPIGRLIEETIKKKNEGMDPDALQVAFISDRINHTNRVIVPALESHDFVLADRYEASTISYVGADKRQAVFDFQRKMGIRVADLTLIIDLDLKEAVKRVYGRGDQDIFDNIEKFKKVRKGYEWYTQMSQGEVVWVDGNGSREEVHGRVMQEIVSRGWLR